MQLSRTILGELIFGRESTRANRIRRPRKVVLSCDSLEERVTPAHIGVAHHAVAHLHAAHHAHVSTSTTTAATTTSTATAATAFDFQRLVRDNDGHDHGIVEFHAVHRARDAEEGRPDDRAGLEYDRRPTDRDHECVPDPLQRRTHSQQLLGPEVLREQPGNLVCLRDDIDRQYDSAQSV